MGRCFVQPTTLPENKTDHASLWQSPTTTSLAYAHSFQQLHSSCNLEVFLFALSSEIPLI